jgi:hypothetical protein
VVVSGQTSPRASTMRNLSAGILIPNAQVRVRLLGTPHERCKA